MRVCSRLLLIMLVVVIAEQQANAFQRGGRGGREPRERGGRQEVANRQSDDDSDDGDPDDGDPDDGDDGDFVPQFIPQVVPQTVAASPVAPPPPAEQQAPSTALLAKQMNLLCWTLHRNYKDKAEFTEAYQEAYELLELSKKIDATFQAGNTGAEFKELLSDFSGEIHHVEHHVVEFTAEDKTPTDAGARLEEVEATLNALLKSHNVAQKSGGHDHDEEDKANPKELGEALATKMNLFCWTMIKNHKGKPDFDEAYQESYELLGIAKTIEKAVASGKIGADAKEALTDFDSEIHHVEHHVTVFAGGGKVEVGAAEDPAVTQLEDVEGTLHQLMLAAGVKSKHAKAHVHDGKEKEGGEEKTAAAGAVTKDQALAQATELTQKMALFCNSMNHNYKKNPDFTEAYKEAFELYGIAKEVEDGIKAGGITDAVKENLAEMDSEIHHVEKHVKEFKADDDGSKDGPRRLGRKLEEVEKAMHVLMQSAGVKRKHVEKGDHDHEEKK